MQLFNNNIIHSGHLVDKWPWISGIWFWFMMNKSQNKFKKLLLFIEWHLEKNDYCFLVDNNTIFIILQPLFLKIEINSWAFLVGTDSTKINRPGHNIRMHWTNFRQPTAHAQQNIFGKTLIDVRSLRLYASFGIFYAKIGLLFETQWVFEVCLKIDN